MTDCRMRSLREADRPYTEMGATGHAERVGRELGASPGGPSSG